MTLVLKVFGVPECLEAFRELPRGMRNRHMRIAMNAGGGIIRDSAVAHAPRETGLLRKSLKVKVRVPDASHNSAHWGRPAYAVIGPSRYVIGAARSTPKGTRLMGPKRAVKFVLGGGKLKPRVPSRYAHLVEKGTKPHKIRGARINGGKGIQRGVHPGTKARSFLARAVRNVGTVAQMKVISKLREGMLSDVRRRYSASAWQRSIRTTNALGIGA